MILKVSNTNDYKSARTGEERPQGFSFFVFIRGFGSAQPLNASLRPICNPVAVTVKTIFTNFILY